MSLGALYSGLYGDNKTKTMLAFANDPANNRHQSQGLELDAHSLGLNAALGLRLRDNIALSASYGFMTGKNSSGHEAALQIKIDF